MSNLHPSTLRDLALVIVLVADAAWDGTKKAMARLRPYIEPPEDLEIRSYVGGVYTGVLLIDRNDVIAGVVVRVGQRSPSDPSTPRTSAVSSPWSARSSPLVTPSSSHYRGDHEQDNDDGKLPGWAEDSRGRELDRWRR